MKVAILTSKELIDKLEEDDDYLLDALKKKNVEYSIVPWNNTYTFNISIIRATYDYYKQPKEFLRIISNIKNLYNNYNIIKYNIDKKYLFDLQSKGVAIIPTIEINYSKINELENIIKNINTEHLILKPRMSLSAYDTIKFNRNDITSAVRLLEAQRERDFILQPFIETINTIGELSLIFIDEVYSHTVRKVPKKDDFRSQPEYGSDVSRYYPDPKIILVAESIIKQINLGYLLYARVDLVLDDSNNPLLMELEMIEPTLYFKWCPEAAERMVDSIIKLSQR